MQADTDLGVFEPVVWFGIIEAGAMIITFSVTEIAIRRLDLSSALAMAQALFVINGLLIASMITFGLAGNFGLAVGTYWAAGLLRTIHSSLAATWLNQNLNSQVRATVLSMVSQADALRQFTGGSVIGMIGTIRSLRAAMVAAGLLLSPALALYGHALKGGQNLVD